VFQPRFSKTQVHGFVDRLELFEIGYSWAGVTSLAVAYDFRAKRGRPDYAHRIVRLNIGLEDVSDLKEDLGRADVGCRAIARPAKNGWLRDLDGLRRCSTTVKLFVLSAANSSSSNRRELGSPILRNLFNDPIAVLVLVKPCSSKVRLYALRLLPMIRWIFQVS
jgi:hypothetical protein